MLFFRMNNGCACYFSSARACDRRDVLGSGGWSLFRFSIQCKVRAKVDIIIAPKQSVSYPKMYSSRDILICNKNEKEKFNRISSSSKLLW